MDILDVYYEQRKIGELCEAREGLLFTYDSGWLEDPEAMPLSLSLPLDDQSREARHFFANLLPEGAVREYLCKSVLRIDYADDFALLKAIGGDCAGALSLYPQGEGPPAQDGHYHRLDDEKLEALLDSPLIPPTSFLREGEKVRLSLAGAQDKVLVAEFGGAYFLPVNGAASTHIVKPRSIRLENMVENEAYCMRLAQLMDIDVPESGFVEIFDEIAYKTTRYDRQILAPGRVRRLHQEDFCQALGVGHADKYQDHGGPGFKQCFALLKKHSRTPVHDRQKLLSLVTFNYLVGNTDCHAKNLSLIYDQGSPRLAPAYDIVSGLIYPHFHNMAMWLGGAENANKVEIENWQAFAEEVGLRPRVVLAALEESADSIREPARELAQQMSERCSSAEVFSQIAELIIQRSEKSLRQLGRNPTPMPSC